MFNIFLRKTTSIVTISTLVFSTLSPWGNTVYAIDPLPSFTTTETQANVIASGAATASVDDAIIINTPPMENDTITIGGTVYTFKDGSYSDPAVENEIRVGSDPTETASNIINAINGTTCTPAGNNLTLSEICSGIIPDTNVIASSGSSLNKITLTATNPGQIGNVSILTSNPGSITVVPSLNGGIDAISAEAQVVDFIPENISSGTYILRMTIAGESYTQVVSSGSTVQDTVEALQASITGNPPSGVSCTEDDIKITCTADVAGVPFNGSSSTIINESILHESINTEFSDGNTRTILALNPIDYTSDSWTAYSGALYGAIDTESAVDSVNQINVDTAVSDLASAKASLITYNVPGSIDTATGAFISSLSGSVELSNLDIGASYELLYGGDRISSGVLLATSTTGSLEIQSGYITDFGNYTLVLSGSKNNSANSNLDSRWFYMGPVDFGSLYPSIGSTLESVGIQNNFSGITNTNVTAYNGLYFEVQSGALSLGRITFNKDLNLTDSDTVNLLQNLENSIDMSNGHINFNPGNNPILNTGATIEMYFTGSNVPDFTGNALDYITAKDGSGVIIPDALSGSTLLCAVGVGIPYQICTFTNNHFTSFDFNPYLTSVSIQSNNSNSGTLAKNGDVITLSFSGSEALTGVTVNFDGIPAAQINGGGNSWIAISSPIGSGSNNGPLSFTIDYNDLNDNIGTTVIGTTDNSEITIDTQNPTATVEYSTTGATSQDVIATLTGASESITGTLTHTFTGNGNYTFNFSDLSGNTGSIIATVNNINKDLPIVTLNGSGTINIEQNSVYTELGANWSDLTDGTGVVSVISGTVNTGSLGTYTLEYIKINSLGNTGSITRTVNVGDATPPTLHEVTSITGITNDSTPSLTIWSSELANPTFSGACQSNFGQFGAGNNTITLDALSGGTYNACYLILTDISGNPSTPLLLSTFTVDATPPTGSISSPIANSYLTGTVTINATATDTGGTGIAKVEFWYYSMGTKIGEDTTYPYSINWNTIGINGGDGAHNLLIKAYDNAGNIYTSSGTPINVDNAAPTVTTIGTGGIDYTLPLLSPNLYGVTMTFNEELNSTGKTLIQNALTTGADKALTFRWGTGTISNKLRISYSGSSTVTFINDVEANAIDLAGNSNVLLLIDSKLDNTQTTPDGSGAVTASTGSSQVVITDPIQPVIATIPSGVNNPSIDVSSFINGGTGILPQITIDSENANNVNVEIPASTTVTSADSSWDGIIAAPTVTTVTIPNTGTETRTLSTAIEVGFTGAKLSFDKAVRILIPGQAGKRAGYIRTGISFTEITTTCSADTQVAGDSLLADSECKIDSGSDLVIWTKHFTSFATFSATTNNNNGGSNGNNSGGGGGGGGSSISTDYCPTGDTSGSLYDGKCIKVITTTGSTNTGTNVIENTGSINDEIIFDNNASDLQIQGTSTGKTKTTTISIFKTKYIGKNRFSDISNSFAQNEINHLAQKGILKGHSDGTFKPNADISRIEFLAIAMKIFGINTSSTKKLEFKDEFDSWMIPYVIKAKELGIIKGQIINGKLIFRPLDSITRAEALAILFKIAKINTSSTKKLEFKDEFDSWMIPYVIKAKELGIIKGQIINGKLIFRPSDTITRQESIKIMANTYDLLVK